MWARGSILVGTVVLTIAVTAPPGATAGAAAAAATTCDRWASPGGNDANPGTQAQPVASIGVLATRLTPGQTGCLAAGQTFVGQVGEYSAIVPASASGTNSTTGLKTIRSAPGGRARFSGPLQVNASYIRFADIDFLGRAQKKATHIVLLGTGDELVGNDIQSPNGICIVAGQLDAYGNPPAFAAVPANGFVLDGNRIHNCGTSLTESDWTPGSSGVHAVYIVLADGGRIVNNLIYDTVNRGIQLWPAASNTTIERNVLDGNGSALNFGSCWTNDCAVKRYATNTTARFNLITNSTLRSLTKPAGSNFPSGDTAQVHGNYPPGTTDTQYGNVVRDNCVFHAQAQYNADPYRFDGTGISHPNNTFADPLYVDRTAKDFRLRAGSPCAAYGPQTAAPSADLAVSQAAPATARTGDVARWTVTVTNGGSATATDVRLTAPSCSPCTLGSLAPGASTIVTVSAALAAPGDFVSTATVSSSTPDSSTGNNTNTAHVNVTGPRCTVVGTLAADTFTGTAADDVFCGFDGIDIVDYSAATAAVVVNLTNGDMYQPNGGNQGYDRLLGIEGAKGSAYADTMFGSTTVRDVLNGRGGNDLIYGYAGDDSLAGGGGKDTLYGGSGTDVLDGGSGTDRCVDDPGTTKVSCER